MLLERCEDRMGLLISVWEEVGMGCLFGGGCMRQVWKILIVGKVLLMDLGWIESERVAAKSLESRLEL